MGMNREAAKIRNYVRIRRAEKRDPEKIHRSLQQSTGLKHPEKIMGYAGFLYDPGDIYVSGRAAEQMKTVKEFRSFVEEALKRFDKGDFGQISRGDELQNIENRYLFGVGRVFGRYLYHYPDCGRKEGDRPDEFIRIRQLGKNTWITYDSEPDWFLFLEEDRLEGLPDFDWRQEAEED